MGKNSNRNNAAKKDTDTAIEDQAIKGPNADVAVAAVGQSPVSGPFEPSEPDQAQNPEDQEPEEGEEDNQTEEDVIEGDEEEDLAAEEKQKGNDIPAPSVPRREEKPEEPKPESAKIAETLAIDKRNPLTGMWKFDGEKVNERQFYQVLKTMFFLIPEEKKDRLIDHGIPPEAFTKY